MRAAVAIRADDFANDISRFLGTSASSYTRDIERRRAANDGPYAMPSHGLLSILYCNISHSLLFDGSRRNVCIKLLCFRIYPTVRYKIQNYLLLLLFVLHCISTKSPALITFKAIKFRYHFDQVTTFVQKFWVFNKFCGEIIALFTGHLEI